MSRISLPAVWLIVLIVGLPQLSETVYTPALPDIARALRTSDAMVEYTLTIYLFGFALGTLFWGRVSDKYGRKPCLLIGLGLYLLGCVGCYASTSIEMLMLSRLLQSFGGSVGSVLGQAICRDAFHGQALGKMYATTGTAIAIFPAIGPTIGGVIDQNFGWPSIFLFLILFGIFVSLCTLMKLEETHPHASRSRVSLRSTAKRMVKDSRVLILGFLVAGGNGISFSYCAEGPFFMIEMLGLSPSQYGNTFLIMSGTGIAGGFLSRWLHNYRSSEEILHYGLWVLLITMIVFAGGIGVSAFISMPREILIGFTVIVMAFTGMGFSLTLANALAISLQDYRQVIGTASSLFGFAYYVMISLFTFGMGYLHNDTLYPMPLYFLGIAVAMKAVSSYIPYP